MKLILKKYLMPLILFVISILVITILRLIQGVKFDIRELALWGSILSSVLIIRTIDDLFDYQDDLNKNKKVISLKVQCILFITFAISTIVLNVYLGKLFGLISSVAYLLFLTTSFKTNTFLKIFIYPFILICSFMMLFNIYNNGFNNITSYIYILVVVVLVIVISIIYGIIKRGKKI